MSNFTEPLIIYQIKPGIWKTDREFKYHVGAEGSDDIITVPEGFETDLASVPWPASMLIPKSGWYNQSAVLHDFLYSILGEITPPYNMKKRTRAQCDYIFKEAMKNLGVNWFKRGTMYNAVRLGGWMPWDAHAKRILAGITVFLFLFISGCGFTRSMDVTIKGDKIRSPFGMGDADIHYQSNTTAYLFQ